MKNQLDEMQEQKLLKIEHNMAWLAFWGLLAAIVAQVVLLGFGDFKAIAGECIVVIVISVYLVIDCVHNGIWDRKLKADPKTNFLASLIGALIFGAVTAFRVYHNSGDLDSAVYTFLLSAAFVLVLCYGLLTLIAGIYKKRLKKMEDSEEE